MPAAFARALRRVQIPPDCLFTVRFGGGTWHQFVPRHPGHPALFALSCLLILRLGRYPELPPAKENGVTNNL